MKTRVKTRMFGAVLTLVGFGLVVWKAGWVFAAGLLIAMWGNNVERGGQ